MLALVLASVGQVGRRRVLRCLVAESVSEFRYVRRRTL